MHTLHFCLLLWLTCFSQSSSGYRGFRESSIYDDDEQEEGDGQFMQDFLMPGVRPSQSDEYLCTAMSLPVQEIYIVDFEPKASMDTAHHLLLFGCESIEQVSSKAWDCGTMGVCRGESQILFAWARNAPSPDIPPNVGFRIGSKANINYLVLQIHYGHIEAFQDGHVDYSGLTLVMTQQRQTFLAGIYLLVSGDINIPPHAENVHTDIACDYTYGTSIHPFAFRTHSHDLGTVISGYRIRNGRWQLLGKGNPQWPQAFYPMEKEFEIKDGDKVAARCTFSAPDRDTYTRVGPTGQDEMCNFYMMYYTDARRGISFQDCMDKDPNLFKNIPPGYDDPPPNPVGFDSMIHHHHVPVHLHEEISIPAYDNDHDLPGDIPNDVLNSDMDADEQLTTTKMIENRVTDTDKVTNGRNISDGIGDDEITQDLSSQEVAHASKPAELHFVEGWPESDLGLGQVGGIAVDSQGNLHVFHRANRIWDSSTFDEDNNFLGDGPIESDTVATLDKNTGNMKKAWGANQFYMPHGLTIDHKDNIWLTDVALHQVFKYPAGDASEPLLTLGEKLVNGNDDEHFCMPTDVAVDTNDDFFVADGYCNSRILKFSPKGKLLMQWSSEHPEFIIPHSLTMIPEKNQVCVADRENGRIACFDAGTGSAVKVYQPSEFGGRVFAVDYSRRDGGILYAINGPVMSSTIKVQGFSIGLSDGQIMQTWAPNDEQFSKPHDVTVSADGSAVYVGEISPNAVWKFRLDLGIHENDKKSAIGFDGDDTGIGGPPKNPKSKNLVMSRAAHAATAIVVCILIVPIVCIFIVAIFVRLRDQGHLGVIKEFPRYKSTQDRFSVGNFFNKRKGFNPVTTEGSDVDDEGSWTDGSDVEEYSRLTGIRTQNL